MLERKIAMKMVGLHVLLLLLQLPKQCKADTRKCHMNDPLPVPHEWYQPGSLIIGGITSHISYHFHKLLFNILPSHELFEVPK